MCMTMHFCLRHLHILCSGSVAERAVVRDPRLELTVGQRLFHRDQFLTNLGCDFLGGAPQTLHLK